jgi:hypothetical protein
MGILLENFLRFVQLAFIHMMLRRFMMEAISLD